jgi:S1-C subfamily serine protease
MGWLEETQAAIASVAEGVGPSVVGVGQRWGVGSGVVVQSGAVLTNAHNVRGDEVEITFSDGSTATGRAAGADVDGDVAVVSVDTASAAPIRWDNGSAPLALGAPVFALSNPGGRGLRVTLGLVSGTERSFRGPRGRRISGSIEHTSPLLPGSSGGPIVDASGSFLGLNTNRLGDGFYLAIPADDDLRQRVSALARGDSPDRPHLGIGVAPPRVARGLRRAVGLPELEGLLVRAVQEDSPAARAGLSEGDLIVEAGGRPASSADVLYAAIEEAGPGGALELKLVRGTGERTVAVSLSPSDHDG